MSEEYLPSEGDFNANMSENSVQKSRNLIVRGENKLLHSSNVFNVMEEIQNIQSGPTFDESIAHYHAHQP